MVYTVGIIGIVLCVSTVYMTGASIAGTINMVGIKGIVI